MNDLVSVVIITYKGTDTIERAIESAINQSHENVEVIVVDDNGIGTPAQLQTQTIIERINSEKVNYICHNINLNGSAARNTGINAAKGKYIALLDDDDAFCKDKIEKQLECLSNKDSSYKMCYTGMKVYYSNGMIKETTPTQEGMLFSDIIKRNIEAQTSTLLFEKGAAKEIDGFDTSFRRHQDWEFMDRFSYQNKIAVVSEPCVERYIYDRNSAKNVKQYVANRMFYLKKMKCLINKLPKKEVKEVYYYHYKEILKQYMKKYDLVHSIKWFIQCGQPVRLLKEIIFDYQKYRDFNKTK